MIYIMNFFLEASCLLILGVGVGVSEKEGRGEGRGEGEKGRVLVCVKIENRKSWNVVHETVTSRVLSCI